MTISKIRRQIGEGNSSSSTKNNIFVQPKFYKIILSQHECTRLRIPEDFARRCCKNMLNPVYLEVPIGQYGRLKCNTLKGQIWLTKGWQDFCDYYSISCGHFLMFRYNVRSHFNVTIFDMSAAEIEYPYSLHTFHCHETHHAPKSYLSELDYSVDILEDIPSRQILKENIPDMRIPVVFAKRHCKNMLNPVFVEAPHGKAWEIEVENSQGQIWLAKGWKDFCGYYSITVRSLLIFTYNPQIEYPIDQEIESDEEEEDIPVLQANANVIEEEKEDIPVNLQANAKVIVEEEEDIPVNLQANANVIEEEEDDIPVNLQANANVIEEDIPVNLQTNANAKQSSKKSTEAEVIPNRNSETAAAIGTTDTDTNTIPLKFAQSTNIINMKKMRLVNEEGVEWGVEIEYTRKKRRNYKPWTHSIKWAKNNNLNYLKETLIILRRVTEKDRQIKHLEKTGTLNILASLLLRWSKKQGTGHIFTN
ncbi:hypothetical protein H5410_006662 [Solanum commersonii]|uniref:TF-B3 domain-containing protein n=1 Tax=Solanum commersonii TaxID=4109 RepID=A0A9J6AAV8_SOLCO|nr:hypothetical protein H5410_006662 [Solanum commersonii]